jgi:hypothetical protein
LPDITLSAMFMTIGAATAAELTAMNFRLVRFRLFSLIVVPPLKFFH